ncbi:Sodium/hydrogen exchanger family-domain-containing protein [Trametes meyenii]|nr:Sodium/hydrogen exchanger family-domain-containing protein [Trametes meyenii]
MGTFSSDIVDLTRRAAAPSQAGIFSGDNPSHYNASDPIRLWVIQAVVIIGFTQLLALVFGRMRQPRVIAEVVGGVILGPSVMGRIPKFTTTIFPDASMAGLNLTANVGLVLFLFIVGMEVDMSLVRRNARASTAISLAGLVLPLGLGAALAVPIYHTFTDGSSNFGYFVLFVAVAVGITAFPVLCRILTELKLLDTTVGVVVLSAGVGNDVVGWILLALAVALINASSGLTALWVLLAGLAYVLFMCFPVRLAYRWLSKKTGSLEAGNPSAMMMTVTLVLVFISAFYTDIIGIHAIFGGFVAGLVIPHDHGYAISMVEKLEDLVSILLLPIYFALSGLRTNLGLLDNGITWGYVVLICVVAFFSKFLGCSIAARLSGFNLRESGAIGTLMSCKGLVELIVLNVGLSAGILDTRTFSMFVLHALILTFMTTPLTLLFYPPKHRVHIGTTTARGAGVELTAEDGHAATSGRADFQGALKTRVSAIVDRVEQLPAVMTLTQLLQSSALAAPAPTPISASASESHEKSVSHSPASPPSLDNLRNHFEPQGRLTLEALRLIELTDRTSAVFKSQSAEALVRSDALLSVLRAFGYLHHVNVSTSLAVVGVDDFPEHVAQHVRDTSSQLVVLPWVSPVVPVEDSPVSTPAPRETVNDPANASASASTSGPFDVLFQQKRDRSITGGQAQYIRRVFSDVPADVALFWDRGLGQPGEGDAQYHLFLPFFGGPDDRLALSLIVQLCLNPCVSASVVRVRKSGSEVLTPMNSIEAEKAWNLLHSSTVHNPAFPDTVYGAQTTQTRLASDTADDLLWARFATSANTAPELFEALSRVNFAEETSNTPLHSVVELATKSLPNRARLLLVAGRARRMAVESHFDELRHLCIEHNASLGTELPKILGEVASAFVAAGLGASMVIVQAATTVGR